MTDGFRLVMTQGPEPGRTFSLDQHVVTMGRDPNSAIVINHPQISRQHARMVRQGNAMVLEDLGSTNGTFVNGMRLKAPHTLEDGDVIGLGDAATFTFYGPPAGMEETLAARGGAVPPPAEAAGPEPRFVPPPAYVAPPALEAPARPARKRRTGMWIGCGCAAVVVVILLVAVVTYMDLRYPEILYAPLRWLGF